MAHAEGFDFVALGDTPYTAGEAADLDRLVDRINALLPAPAFAVHVGDIKSSRGPCTEAYFRTIRERLERIAGALVYTPGDNEWTDCSGVGGTLLPEDSILALRRVFFAHPGRSLGRKPLRLASQAAMPGHGTYVENARWALHGVGFVTLNVPGCGNRWGNRVPAAEYQRLMAALQAWLRESFAIAKRDGQRALVLMMQADPFEVPPAPFCDRGSFAGLLEAIQAGTLAYSRPVLLVHGDEHVHRFDQPWATLNPPVPNFTRLEVCGSPSVAAIVVRVQPGGREPFSIARRLIVQAGRPRQRCHD